MTRPAASSNPAAHTGTFLNLLYPGKSYPHGLMLNLRAPVNPGEPGHLKQDFYTCVAEVLSDYQLTRWEREGRSIFFGVVLRRGLNGDTEACAALPGLWADLDAKRFVEGPLTEESVQRGVTLLRERLAQVFPAEHQPTLLVHSGGGLQAYWLFREPLLLAKPGPERDTQIAQIEGVLRGLHLKVGCLPERQDVASIMRLPGFVNPKYAWSPMARLIDASNRRFTLADLVGYEAQPEPGEPTRERQEDDPDLDLVAAFKARGLYKGPSKRGHHRVTCPWKSEHTTEDGPSSTVIMAPDGNGHPWWGFSCGHGHCKGRGVRDVLAMFWPTADDREADPVATPEARASDSPRHPIAGGSLTNGAGPDAQPEPAANRTDTTELVSILLSGHRTDVGNANRLIASYGDRIRYAPGIGWLFWKGTHWEGDSRDGVIPLAIKSNRKLLKHALALEDQERRDPLVKFAMASESRNKLEAMAEIAKTDARVRIKPEDLDSNPWLLNVQNGTLDLRTGERRPSRLEDLMTRVCPVMHDPAAQCPTWLTFLDRVMEGNQVLVDFLQRAIGCSLTGITTEHFLFLLYGVGRNGKSTFLDLIKYMLGEYAQTLPADSLMVKKYEGMPNDIARLKGVRFASAIETAKGKQLNETLMKRLTGGDPLVGCFKYKEYFEFDPTHKLFLATNHKPMIKDPTASTWERVCLIPWRAQFLDGHPDTDKNLKPKLRAELSGILNWALRGCLAWQESGMRVPEEVRALTEQYQEDQDVLARFAEEHLVIGSKFVAEMKALYDTYLVWTTKDDEGGIPLTQKALIAKLVTTYGAERIPGTNGGGKRLRGVGLKPKPGSGPKTGAVVRGAETPAVTDARTMPVTVVTDVPELFHEELLGIVSDSRSLSLHEMEERLRKSTGSTVTEINFAVTPGGEIPTDFQNQISSGGSENGPKSGLSLSAKEARLRGVFDGGFGPDLDIEDAYHWLAEEPINPVEVARGLASLSPAEKRWLREMEEEEED